MGISVPYFSPKTQLPYMQHYIRQRTESLPCHVNDLPITHGDSFFLFAVKMVLPWPRIHSLLSFAWACVGTYKSTLMFSMYFFRKSGQKDCKEKQAMLPFVSELTHWYHRPNWVLSSAQSFRISFSISFTTTSIKICKFIVAPTQGATCWFDHPKVRRSIRLESLWIKAFFPAHARYVCHLR